MSPGPAATSSKQAIAPAERRHDGPRAGLRRRLPLVLIAIALAVAVSSLWLAATPSLYRSTAVVAFDRNGVENGLRGQIQLVRSRELGREAVRRLGIADHSEFAPDSNSGVAARLFTLVGAARDRTRLSPEERSLERFHEHLTVEPGQRPRAMSIHFVSQDRDLAARAANAVAEGYIELQRSARADTAPRESPLLREVESLRDSVDEAERAVDEYRGEAGLSSGREAAPAATTLASQELAELTRQLSSIRSERMAAEAQARLIRQMIESGALLETSEILDSALIERLSGQTAQVRSQIAELSPTLGPRHPRMRNLNAELGDLRSQAREESERIARLLEEEAELAARNESELREAIESLKAEAAAISDPELQLSLLEREAETQRDRLESLLTRVSAEEAVARSPGPRIVARAMPADAPFYPQPLLVVLGAIAIGALAGGAIAAFLEMRSRAERTAMRMPDAVDIPAGPLAARLEPTALEKGRPRIALAAKDSGLDAIIGAIAAPSAGGEARGVLITSPRRMVEVAEVALRLARRTGAEGRRVVLVDTRFNETIPALSSVAWRGNLADLVTGRAAFESSVTRDPESRVHVIASGRTEASPLALISSDRMEMVLEALSQTYDIVVLLAPALSRQAELRVLANWADSAVLALRGGQADLATAKARGKLADLGLAEVALVTIGEATPDPGARQKRAA